MPEDVKIDGPTITPTIALIAFVIILIVAIIICFIVDVKHFKSSRMHAFIYILIGLGIFITFLFYYSVVELQQQQIALFNIQETSRISTVLLDSILSQIQDSSTSVPNFACSVLPLNQCTAPVDPDTPENTVTKQTTAYKIFSAFQDVLLSDAFVEINDEAYVANFLQRANSKQLFELWKVNKLNFNPSTQTFGDLLFEYGLPITNQIPQSYIDAANKLIADPRYQNLK